jgi:hypothetical protein
MMKKAAILIFSVFIFSSIIQSQTVNQLTEEQRTWLTRANRHEKDGWIYLHIEGTPRERGFQHGYLLSSEIKEAIRVLSVAWNHETAMEWTWFVKNAGTILTPKVDKENLAEIDGIAEGMKTAGIKTTRDEIVALNGYLELMGYWWPSVKDSVHSHSTERPKESCSSFIATGSMTSDGKIVLGHNTMGGYWDPECNVILDILPEKGHRIMMQTTSGLIHSGTDFFIAESGIIGSETTIGAFFPFDPEGVPEFSRMRQATQYAGSIDEWCDIMKKGNNGGYANAWLIGDIKTNEIARLELGLRYIGFEKKKDGYFVGSNVAEDLNILRLETTTDETNIKLSSIARRVRWKELMKENTGKIDINLAESFEADHYDTYLNKDNPGQRTLCGHWELDPQYYDSYIPFNPEGTIDGKVTDSKMAGQMSFIARWGSACGTPFDARAFLETHPQFEWMNGLLKDRPTRPWTTFKAGETLPSF